MARSASELHSTWAEHGDPSPEEAGERGRLRAREILAFAKDRSPYWRERLTGVDPGAVPWRDLPELDRATLTRHLASSFTDPRIRPESVARHLATAPEDPVPGGQGHVAFMSTGAANRPLYLVYDQVTWEQYAACLLRALHRIGAPGNATVAFAGSSDPLHTLPRLAPLVGPDVAVIGLQGGLDRAVRTLNALRPGVLVGYSSALALLARCQLEGSLAIRPSHVLAGADALSADDVRRILAAWGAYPYSYYSVTELGLIASECPARQGMHLNLDTVLVEETASGILMSQLDNRTQPIVRYRLPDPAELSYKRCQCGSATPLIRLNRGRDRQVIMLPAAGGGLIPVHPIVFRSALDRTAPGATIAWNGDTQVTLTVTGGAATARKECEAALAKAAVDVSKVRLVVTEGGGAPCTSM